MAENECVIEELLNHFVVLLSVRKVILLKTKKTCGSTSKLEIFTLGKGKGTYPLFNVQQYEKTDWLAVNLVHYYAGHAYCFPMNRICGTKETTT